MSANSRSTSFSECLVLDDSEKGVIITGITDDTLAAKSGLQAGDKIMAATIHLDHLTKNEVQSILKVLEPYDNNMKVLTKKALTASADLGSLGLGLKESAELLSPMKNLSLDTSAERPVVSLHGPNGNLHDLQSLGSEISGPTPSLSINSPKADVTTTLLHTPSASLNIKKPEVKTGNLKYNPPKFEMPKFSLPRLKTPEAEMDVGNVNLPSVIGNLERSDISLPSPKMNLQSPEVDLHYPDLNLEVPNANIETHSGKVTWPHQKWKGPKVKGPDADLSADLSASDVNISKPNMDKDLCATGGDIDLPKADIKGSNVDLQTGKINWPHLKFKKPKAGLDIDASLDAPDDDLPVPNVDGEVNAPDVDINLLKADIKDTHIDVKTSNSDVETPSHKIIWPHMKLKKSKLQGPKSDLDVADVNTPDLNLSSPKLKGDVDLNLPKIDLPSTSMDAQAPELEMDSPSGKFNWPHLKWGKPKFHDPNTNMDTDLCLPDVDVPAICIGGETNAPDAQLNIPNVNADITEPDANIKAPSGKFKFPTLKKQKVSGPTVEVPDVDLNADVSAPDLKVSVPKIEGEINAPDAQLNLPKVNADIKEQDANIKAPSGKFKFPTLKKQKVSGPTVEVPDVDLDADVSAPDLKGSVPKIEGEINAPEAQLNLPNVNADITEPGANLKAPSGKFKFPTLKKQKVSGPTVEVPDVDLDADISAPDLKVSVPKIEGEINAPDAQVNLPKVNADITEPDANIKAPSGKFKFPTLKKQKVSGPKVKVPDADLNADVSAPDLKVSVPKIESEINAPDTQVNLPKVNADIKTPDANIDAPSGKIRFPTFKKQKVSGPKMEVPDVDLDADVSAPHLKVSVPKIEGGINAPDVNIDGPSGKFKFPFKKQKVPGPKVKVPDVDLDADVSAPDLKVSVPKIEGDINAPDAQVNLPKVNADIKTPDANIDAPFGKFKFPKFKKQKVSGPKVNVPDVDLDANVSAPDMKFTVPKVEGEINSPETQVNVPKVNTDIKAPDVSINAPSGKFKFPTLKKQKVKVKVPDVALDADVSAPEINAPDINLKSPKTDLDISALDTEGLSGKLKGLKADFGAGVKSPHVDLKEPDIDLSTTDINLAAPKHSGGIKAPELNVSKPYADVSVNPPEGKVKLLKFKFPKIKDSKIKGSELDADVDSSKISLDGPKVDINTPNVSAAAPQIKGLNDPKLSFLSGPGVKEPNLDANAGVTSPDLGRSYIDQKLAKTDPTAPNISLKAPELNFSQPQFKSGITAQNLTKEPYKAHLKGLDVNVNTPNIDSEVPSLELPTAVIKAPNLSLSAPRIKGDLSPSNLDADFRTDVKGPSVNPPKTDLEVPDLNFKAPDIILLSPKNVSTPNIDAKLPKSELEAPGAGIKLPTDDLKEPDALIETPDLHCDPHLGDFKLPHCKFPNLDLSSPELEVPTVQTHVEAPRVKVGSHTGDATTSAPSVDLSVLNLERTIKRPELDVKAPNIDTSLDKSKGLNLKFPKLSFSGSKTKAPVNSSANLDMSSDVKVKAPSVEAGVSSPDVNTSPLELKKSLNRPELNVRNKGGSEPSISNAEADIPLFKFHRLPRNSIEDIGEIGEALGLSKSDAKTKSYVVSKGIRLPIISKSAKAGEKIDIMERLKMAKEKVQSADVSAPMEARISSLVRGGNFKIENSSDENDKLSLGLSNMLGLNTQT